MSADAVYFGSEAKVDIEGVAFAVTGGQYQVQAAIADRTDTESEALRAKRSPLRKFTCSLQAQRASDVSYHAAPFLFGSGDSVWLRVWPNGRDDPEGPYDIPAFVVGQFSSDFQVAGGSQIQTVTLQGESDNAFTCPGEV